MALSDLVDSFFATVIKIWEQKGQKTVLIGAIMLSNDSAINDNVHL